MHMAYWKIDYAFWIVNRLKRSAQAALSISAMGFSALRFSPWSAWIDKLRHFSGTPWTCAPAQTYPGSNLSVNGFIKRKPFSFLLSLNLYAYWYTLANYTPAPANAQLHNKIIIPYDQITSRTLSSVTDSCPDCQINEEVVMMNSPSSCVCLCWILFTKQQALEANENMTVTYWDIPCLRLNKHWRAE